MLFNEKLKFPIQWHYSFITTGQKQTVTDIETILKNKSFSAKVKENNISKNGTYKSYSLSVTFYNKKDMDSLSLIFSKVNGIKFLL